MAKRQTKKQKIDEQQQQPFNINEIEIGKLNKLNKDEIIKIAKSIGIQRTTTKIELISNIISLIEKRKEISVRDIQIQSINSFNKINQLNKTNDIEPLESSFWKIFRNKTIYKNIMSFMDKIYSLPYESIIDLSKMLKENKISMIKDKVKIGQHLKLITGFSSTHTYNGNGNDTKDDDNDNLNNENVWSFLFYRITDDKVFYNQFFKNYGKYLPFFQNDKCFIGKSIIKAGCLVALEVLIEDFSYIPKKQCLEKAIRFDRIEIIDFLLQPKFDLIKPITTTTITTINNTISKTRGAKQQQQQQSNKEIDILATSLINNYYCNKGSVKKRFKTLKHLIENSKIINLPIPLDSVYPNPNYPDSPKMIYRDFAQTLFQTCPIELKYKLKDLIRAVEIIQMLDIGRPTNNQYQTIIKESNNLFSKQQLKSTLCDPINYKSQQKDQIKQLFQVYYSANKHHSTLFNLEYMICYDGIKQISDDSFLNWGDRIVTLFLEYGCTELLDLFLKTIGNYFTSPTKFLLNSTCILLKKCIKKDDDNGGTDYDNSSISIDITKEIEIFLNKMMIIAPKETTQIALESDNLKVIKYCCDRLTPDAKRNCSMMSKFIKSTQTLDYIFREHNTPFLDGSLVGDLQSNFQNFQLLKHYQLLSNNSGSQFKIPIDLFVLKNESIDYSTDEFKQYYDIQINHINVTLKNPCLLKNEKHQFNYISLLKFITKEIKDYNISNILDIGSSSKFYIPKHIADYLIYCLFKGGDSDDITKIPIKRIVAYLLYFKCCKDNDFTQMADFIDSSMNEKNNSPIFVLSNIIRFIVKRNSFKLLDLILKNATKSQQSMNTYKPLIYEITLNAISSDQISILEFIFLNYSQVFKKISNKTPNLNNGFSQMDLNNFAIFAFRKNNLITAEFLLKIFNFSKTQFERYSTIISKNHFKDFKF